MFILNRLDACSKVLSRRAHKYDHLSHGHTNTIIYQTPKIAGTQLTLKGGGPYPTTTTPQMQLSSIALLEQRQDLVQFTLHSLLYK
jgi:hypothetical protein